MKIKVSAVLDILFTLKIQRSFLLRSLERSPAKSEAVSPPEKITIVSDCLPENSMYKQHAHSDAVVRISIRYDIRSPQSGDRLVKTASRSCPPSSVRSGKREKQASTICTAAAEYR